MAGSVLSDICVINKSGVSSEGWAESKVILLTRGALFLHPCFQEEIHWKGCLSAWVCSHFAFVSGPQDTHGEQTGKGWHKRHPGPCQVLRVLLANASPFLIPCWQLGLGFWAAATGSALLPARCGEHEAQIAQLEI